MAFHPEDASHGCATVRNSSGQDFDYCDKLAAILGKSRYEKKPVDSYTGVLSVED